jgi:hypothetical protein
MAGPNMPTPMPGGRPARPMTPTPLGVDSLMDALYGGPQQPPQPLPADLPPNVQDYIRNRPSYSESQAQNTSGLTPGSITGGEAPYVPNPQIDDLRRQFRGAITRNAPTSTADPARARLLKQFMGQPGFQGFTDDTKV